MFWMFLTKKVAAHNTTENICYIARDKKTKQSEYILLWFMEVFNIL